MLETVTFQGFGQDAAKWFTGLAADNSKAYFDRTRSTYEASIRELERYRAAVAEDKTGTKLEKAVADVTSAGLDVVGDKLKTVPRGYARDHARADLLAHKDLIAGAMLPAGRALGDRRAYDFTARTWKAAEPLVKWLDANVGESTAPPEERWRR